MVILEVCCGSLESAIVAQKAGAHRIELCSALDEGGLTPSVGLMRAVAKLEGIKKHVLIRPRGGDFLYTEAEKEVMIWDIQTAISEGFDGVVIGALTSDGHIDVDLCHDLVRAAQGASVTFHRAFDLCANQMEALEQIIGLGCHRILTSGGAATAFEGREKLACLVKLASGRIGILPGAGVNATNVAELLRETKATEVHASARTPQYSAMRYVQEGVSMGASDRDEYLRYETSFSAVRDLLQEIWGSGWE